MENKNILFKKVKCTSFLKKVHDGKFIQIYKGDLDEAAYCDSNNPDAEIMSECCGETDFLKTYYEVKERLFSGFVVGIKDIIITAYLVADTGYHPWDCGEFLQISREPEKVIKCAVVYYRNNCKRYVPLDSIEGGD